MPMMWQSGRSRATLRAVLPLAVKATMALAPMVLATWRAAAQMASAAVGDGVPAGIALHAGDDTVHDADRLDRILAGGGFGGEHDRVRTVEHGGGDVRRFGAGGSGSGDHALQHLSRHHHRAAEDAGGADDAFLGERDFLGGKLDAEIAAGDHHAIGEGEDFVEALQGLGFFQLAHDRGATGGDGAGLGDILGALDEGQADPVDTLGEDEIKVPPVLGRQRGDGQDDIRHVDALAVRERAADDDFGLQMVGANAGDA
jgi:hypothetical protein